MPMRIYLLRKRLGRGWSRTETALGVILPEFDSRLRYLLLM